MNQAYTIRRASTSLDVNCYERAAFSADGATT